MVFWTASGLTSILILQNVVYYNLCICLSLYSAIQHVALVDTYLRYVLDFPDNLQSLPSIHIHI